MKDQKYINSQKMFLDNINIVGDDREDLDSTYPFFIKSSVGCTVTDYDNNNLIDYTAANGSIILGYSNEEVDDYVIWNLRNKGNILPTQYSDLKVKLTKKLLEYFHGMERAIYFKTGSDATDAAIRLARVHTGKDVILTSGYHGWHDWQLNCFPEYKFKDDRHVEFGYNLSFLDEYLANCDNVAGVIVTPDLNFFTRQYFKELEQITQEHNVLLILDEIASGFRYGFGGITEYLNLNPSMVCLSKGLANGYSISAVLGKNSVMKGSALKTHMWGSFNAEMLGFTAALKTQEILVRENTIKKIEERSKFFVDGLCQLFKKYNLVAEVLTLPNIFHIVFDNEYFGEMFNAKCADNGVLLSKDNENMLTYCHTADVINKSLKNIEKAICSIINKSNNCFCGNNKLSLDTIQEKLLSEVNADIKWSRFANRK